MSDYRVIDYATASVAELAELFLTGWESAPGTHQSLTAEDDLSYVVLTKRKPVQQDTLNRRGSDERT